MENQELLPLEVVTNIMDYLIVESVQSFNAVRGTCRYFRNRYKTVLLPRIHIYDRKAIKCRETWLGKIEISVAEMRREFGEFSGLVQKVKSIVATDVWADSFLWLEEENHSWYRVCKIVWKKNKTVEKVVNNGESATKWREEEERWETEKK